MIDNIPRESVEYYPVDVASRGIPVVEGVELSVTADKGRPVTWVAAVVSGGQANILLGAYAPGYWRIWARYANVPELPVVDCGLVRIT